MDAPLFDPFAALAEIRREAQSGQGRELPQKLPQDVAEAFCHDDQRVSSSSAASAASAGGQYAQPVAHARVKEEEGKDYSIKSFAYARAGSPQAGSPERSRNTPAEVAEAAEVELTICETTTLPKIAAAEVLGADLRKWRAGLEALSADRVPCPGYTPTGWAMTLSRAHAFLDVFGQQAEALGWTTHRLFAVHPTAGIIRPDACGGLMMPLGSDVRAITGETISFGHLTHRRRLGQVLGIPVWEFGQ